jgi:hypothetical protein
LIMAVSLQIMRCQRKVILPRCLMTYFGTCCILSIMCMGARYLSGLLTAS